MRSIRSAAVRGGLDDQTTGSFACTLHGRSNFCHVGLALLPVLYSGKSTAEWRAAMGFGAIPVSLSAR